MFQKENGIKSVIFSVIVVLIFLFNFYVIACPHYKCEECYCEQDPGCARNCQKAGCACKSSSPPCDCKDQTCSTVSCTCGGTGCNCGQWCSNGGSRPCAGKGCKVGCLLNGCNCTNMCKKATTQCNGVADCGCESANPQRCLPGCSVDGCCVNNSGTSCIINCHCGCLLTGPCTFNWPPSTCFFCQSSMQSCSPSTCINT